MTMMRAVAVSLFRIRFCCAWIHDHRNDNTFKKVFEERLIKKIGNYRRQQQIDSLTNLLGWLWGIFELTKFYAWQFILLIRQYVGSSLLILMLILSKAMHYLNYTEARHLILFYSKLYYSDGVYSGIATIDHVKITIFMRCIIYLVHHRHCRSPYRLSRLNHRLRHQIGFHPRHQLARFHPLAHFRPQPQ